MKQTQKNKHFLQALAHAVSGLKMAFHSERNIRIDCMAAIAVIVVGVLLQCTGLEWLWLLQSIVLVIVLELCNTVVETIVDEITQGQYFLWAKRAKDIAAGMVVVGAVYALIVAVVIFMPKLWS